MTALVVVGVGLLGGVGAVARFLLDGAVASRAASAFPWGTLAVNLSGALALGILHGAGVSGDALRLFGTGLLGAYTTFSTWMLESHRLGEDGRLRLGWANVRRQPRARPGLRVARRPDRRSAVTDALKLTTYFGERDRAGDRFLADALADLYARHRLRTSLVLRGVAGFGVKHHLHTDRLLTLSEDLPMVSVAVDARARIEALLDEVVAVSGDGLITLERARMADAAAVAAAGEEAKLTVHLGRGERAGGRPAHIAVVDALHRHGVAGATVLLGVDGTTLGERRRARFFAANTHVPLMVIAVGAGRAPRRRAARTARAAGRAAHDARARARVQARRPAPRRARAGRGHRPVGPGGVAEADGLLRRAVAPRAAAALLSRSCAALRAAGAAGATALRGIWGYHGDHAPHGDSFRQLRRRVPVVTVIVDTPERIARWFAIVDALTDETGLVTSEQVPALRAAGPGIARGGLRLADPRVR